MSGRPSCSASATGSKGFRNTASLEVARAQAAIDGVLSAAEADAAVARGRGWGRAEALAVTP